MPYTAEVPARRGNQLYARTARGCGDNTGITLIARPLRLAGDGERRGGSIALFPVLSTGGSPFGFHGQQQGNHPRKPSVTKGK